MPLSHEICPEQSEFVSIKFEFELQTPKEEKVLAVAMHCNALQPRTKEYDVWVVTPSCHFKCEWSNFLSAFFHTQTVLESGIFFLFEASLSLYMSKENFYDSGIFSLHLAYTIIFMGSCLCLWLGQTGLERRMHARDVVSYDCMQDEFEFLVTTNSLNSSTKARCTCTCTWSI